MAKLKDRKWIVKNLFAINHLIDIRIEFLSIVRQPFLLYGDASYRFRIISFRDSKKLCLIL